MMAEQQELLAAIGKALFGDEWKNDLAREIGVDERTLRRWSAGTRDISDGVWADLQEALTKRAFLLDGLSQGAALMQRQKAA